MDTLSFEDTANQDRSTAIIMTEPFVVRNFKIDKHDVECRFYKPQPDNGDWVCQYEIDFPEKRRRSQGYGVDSIQALLLAMKKAHVELLVLRSKKGFQVKWLDDDNLGLPLDDMLHDLSPDNHY